MTNGEKIVNTFHGKVSKNDGVVYFSTGGWLHAYDAEWWNAEYKEPTKNDSEIDMAIKIIKADELVPYSVEDILKARDLAVEALKQMGTTKNDSKFCPDRKAKTTHMETLLHCVEDECVAYKDGKCLKYNSDQEPTAKNDLEVEKIIDEIEEEFEKVDIPIMDKLTLFAKVQNSLYRCAELTKASEDAYNKGYADGVKSVNICPNCGEYIGEEE